MLAAQHADGRTAVVERQRAAELRQIAHRHPGHGDGLRRLVGGWITSADAVQYLDTLAPHARLNAIRDSGELMLERWVKVCDAQGRERTLKAYRIVASLDGEGVAE